MNTLSGSGRKPHIVIFNPDQWRGDVMGHMGNPAAVTPTLDAAVQEDFVSFRSAFCQNPVCTPSRCSFMTGWYPHVRGHRTMHHMLRAGEPSLLRQLKENGYHVWWGGKNDLIASSYGQDAHCTTRFRTQRPTERGTHALSMQGGPDGNPDYYSMYLGKLTPQTQSSAETGVYYDGDWAEVLGAVEFIRNAPPDQPICLFLALLYPHPPYGVEEPYYSQIDRNALPERIPAPDDWAGKPSLLRGIHERQSLHHWTEDRWDDLRATYYGMCARVDAQFALLLQALRDAGMYDDTAVFFFSDHGDFTGDYGLVEKTQNTFEDCLTRVPFLVKPPKDVPVQPRVSEALVELTDFPATVYNLCGIEPGYTHFGRSLLSVVAGETDTHRDAVFCEGGRSADEMHASENESLKVTGDDSLYLPRVGLQGRMPEHTRATMCRTERYKYVRRLYESDELYDLESDPGETRNRIDDPAMAGVAAEMKDRMLRWYQETCDVVPHDPDRR